jgi:signal transduction histidine kinase
VLSGAMRLSYKISDGSEHTAYTYHGGEAFGEVALLANIPSATSLHADEPSELIEFTEDQFWKIMNLCPEIRKTVLGNMAYRLAKIQSNTFQQEKMAALGTMAAGLMHELNNPGAAARRAAAQLRENLIRLQSLSARLSRSDMQVEQRECMFELQEQAMSAKPADTLNSLEQSDREESLAEWLDSAGVEQAWKLAPTFVSVGIDADSLICASHTFQGSVFSDALSWLEALVSSMQLVGTIEESIGRVSDLVMAVKSYAYEGRGEKQTVDVNRSILATLLILGHKLREKQITIDKQLDHSLPALETGCHGVNQIWTNLLDNAIDAAPQGGHITIKTWPDRHPAPLNGNPPRVDLCILITDNGTGIPSECQARIFDPFFTTKPVGVGTGLGLGIVYRIVEQCGGVIHFSSTPGETEFAVRLPTHP